MRKDKRDAEVLRVIFGTKGRLKRFNYQWHLRTTPTGESHYEMVAVQKSFDDINPTAKFFWPLRENTLYILEGLKEALPIFQIQLNDANKVQLLVTINDVDYNVLTQWPAIEDLLNPKNPLTNSLVQIPIRLNVSSDVYNQFIEPHLPAKHSERLRRPNKVFLQETFKEVFVRLQSQTETLPQPSMLNALLLRTIISDVFKKEWVSANTAQGMQVFTQAFRNDLETAKQCVVEFPQNANAADILGYIQTLFNLLQQFYLHDYIEVYGTAQIVNERRSANLMKISPLDALILARLSSPANPTRIVLTVSVQTYETKFLPLIEKFVFPEQLTTESATTLDMTSLVAMTVDVNQSLIVPSLIRKTEQLTVVGVEWYDSDEEEDAEISGTYNMPIKIFDLRGGKGTHERHKAWFDDQKKIDNEAREKAEAERKKAEEDKTRFEASKESFLAKRKLEAAANANKSSAAPSNPQDIKVDSFITGLISGKLNKPTMIEALWRAIANNDYALAKARVKFIEEVPDVKKAELEKLAPAVYQALTQVAVAQNNPVVFQA